MRVKHSAIILIAGFILMPTLLWSQPGGGGAPGGGAAGGGNADRAARFFGSMDPDQLFNMMSKGQDVIRVESMDPVARQTFDRFASRFGITGNEISRDQFRESFARIKQAAASGQLPQLMAPGKNDGPGGGMDRIFDDRFNQLDRNHDGELSNDELNGHPLQDEMGRYDGNSNGFIDLTEYKAYAMARVGPLTPGGRDGRDRDQGESEEARRPVMYRAGNLPRDFPYASLDENGDRDGQVGLYEWKNAGKRIPEFLELDLNKDGFLTVDEYYRYRRQHAPQTANTSLFGDVPDPAMLAMNPRGVPSRGDGRDRGGDRGPGGFDMGRGMGGPPGMGGFPAMGGMGFPGAGGMGFPGMDMARGGRDGDRGRDNRDRGGDMMGRGGPGGPGGDLRGRGQEQGGGPRMTTFTPGGDAGNMRMQFGPGGGGMTPAAPGMMPGAFPGGMGQTPGSGMSQGGNRERGGPGMMPPGGGGRDRGAGTGFGGPPGGGGRDRGGFGGGGPGGFGGGGPGGPGGGRDRGGPGGAPGGNSGFGGPGGGGFRGGR